MRSRVTEDFRKCFAALPKSIQNRARRAFRRWSKDTSHPGLHFKLVQRKNEVYSVRIGIGWRALGCRDEDLMTWFWIGSHADYDKLLDSLD